jgi:hypothetical protein
MSRGLALRAKRNGIRSKYAGDEPRRDELTMPETLIGAVAPAGPL